MAGAANIEKAQRKPDWLLIFALAAAAISCVFFSVPAAIAFLLAAMMAWSKPFEDNRAKGKRAPSDRARIGLGVTFALIGVILLSRSGEASVAADTRPATPARGSACGANGRVTLVDFAVKTSTALRASPEANAEQVKVALGNQGEMPITIDHTMPVRELCRSGDWSEVRVLMSPNDIGRAQGWVPTAALRPVKTNAEGRRVYVASDLEFSDGSSRYAVPTLAVVNRVMEQDPTCDAINNLILVERDRTGVKLHFSCFGETERSFDFTPADATNGRDFTPAKPVAPISGGDAILACENAARQRITHPSTADFSIMGADFTSDDDGSSTYTTTFKARNSFNLELEYQVVCDFRGSNLTDINIVETS